MGYWKKVNEVCAAVQHDLQQPPKWRPQNPDCAIVINGLGDLVFKAPVTSGDIAPESDGPQGQTGDAGDSASHRGVYCLASTGHHALHIDRIRSHD